MFGEAIRWRVVVEVPSRHAEPLFSARMTSWVQLYVPPACLVVDGGSVLASDEAGIMLSRQGCASMFRASTPHAQMVERRQAFLRDQLHK
eukprot:9081594-Lingulodinium_polyedra.AAC.1